MIPGGVNELLLRSAAAGGATAGRSVRFNSADSAYLSRTPASAGNRKTWTWSGWYKKSNPTSEQRLLGTTTDGYNSSYALFYFPGTSLRFEDYLSNATRCSIQTSQLFRDVSAWYHIILAVDTTQATSTERVKIYINGSQVTSFASATYPSLNADLFINTTNQHHISYTTGTLDGYLALVHFIDGQALTPSSFGETSATTGQWIAKTYSGSYGTNGFFLDFADNSTAAALGYDAAGSNDWTVNNISIASGGPTSVAAASGALPIYNTTDTYGTTKGTGTRTDSNSSSISLAIAMDGANNGTTFTDESATIKGSGSAKSITRNGDTKTSTAQSKFYGSSGYFDGTGDYLSLANDADFNFGTGDFTIEAWVYVTAWDGSGQNNIITKWNQSGNGYAWKFLVQSNGNIRFGTGNNGTLSTEFDFSAGSIATNTWHHFAVTRSGTSIRVFMNGVQIGSSATSSNTLSSSSGVVVGASPDGGISQLMNGYMADLRVYKGVAKYTAAFNPPTSTQIASVAAGNDSLRDHPTSAGTSTGLGGEVSGNYATLNPLTLTGSAKTYANGNLEITATSNNNIPSVVSTFGARSGKWYAEVVAGWSASGIGFINADSVKDSIESSYGLGTPVDGWTRYGTYIFNNGVLSSGLTSIATNDLLQLALDLDNGKAWFGINGTWENSGNPANGTNPSVTFTPGGKTFLIGSCFRRDGTAVTMVHNYGARAFAYTAPSGFSPLVDTLLPTPTIAKPNTVMNVVTGNFDTTKTWTVGFNPDLIWIKSRSNADGHVITDSVRGTNAQLQSNTTGAELTNTTAVTSFNSDGFTIGTYGLVSNTSTVAWCWDAGSSNATNTSGTITSTVRANISAGFSIVTYTGNGTAGATIGHGLGVKPSLLICKDRDDTTNWIVQHVSTGATQRLELNTTGAAAAVSTLWNDTEPTSTVFTVGTNGGTNDSGEKYVVYAWAPVAGLSSFGSYVGNGLSDGPFVYTGFRPRWILVRNVSVTQSWALNDTARATYNLVDAYLAPNLSGSEQTTYAKMDILSNGFKVRETDSFINGNGNTHIYACFAEAPFPYARAR